MENKQVEEYWDAIADEWEVKIGNKGDPFRCQLITPLIFDLIAGCSGNLILDAGCGNGYLMRLLASRGYKTYGFDLSQRQLINAKKRNDSDHLIQKDIESICSRQLPLKWPSTFDIIIVSMVLDGIENINAAIESCTGLLSENGWLIITIPHPCFYALFRFSNETFDYLFESHHLLTMFNVTKPVIYYHRPLNIYLETILKNRLTITKIEEPVINDELKKYLKDGGRKELSCLIMGITANKLPLPRKDW